MDNLCAAAANGDTKASYFFERACMSQYCTNESFALVIARVLGEEVNSSQHSECTSPSYRYAISSPPSHLHSHTRATFLCILLHESMRQYSHCAVCTKYLKGTN